MERRPFTDEDIFRIVEVLHWFATERVKMYGTEKMYGTLLSREDVDTMHEILTVLRDNLQKKSGCEPHDLSTYGRWTATEDLQCYIRQAAGG